MNIYVGNLSYDLTDDELKAAFAAYGTVESARIVMDRFSGRSKGFGFVEMPNQEEAMAAISGLNDAELAGRPIKVNESRPKPEGERRPSRGGGGGFRGGPRRGGGFGGGGRRNDDYQS